MEEIRKLRRELDDQKFLQPPTIERLGLTTFSENVPNSTMTIVTTTLTPLFNQTLLGTLESDLYHTAVSGAGLYPTGSNWSGMIGTVRYETWLSSGLSDGKNLKYQQAFYNGSGSGIDAIWQQTFRGFVYTS